MDLQIMENFNNIHLPLEVVTSLTNMKITSPTEIQRETIPIAMEGLDILASSQTGSGKTLAYLLPIISSVVKTKGIGLVLVPTRELANQVREVWVKIASNLRINSAVLIGGEPMPKQLMQLKNSPKLIVGTPGRIIDHLLRGSLKFSNVNIVVLDEMDRMLDMGMKEQLEEINKHIPEKRQVLMFSATMPKNIIALSQKYLVNPKRICIGSSTQAASLIKQETLKLSDREKFPELIKQLNEREGSIIIFVKTKRGADALARMLKSEDHKAEAIHGDLNQGRRDRVIASFRRSHHRIMVATDVAARGLDIPHTQHVINYDLPMCPEDYLHRIGRTGRAGVSGNALSFISPEDQVKWRAIDRLINQGESTSREEMLGDRKPRGNKTFARGPKRDYSNARNNKFGENRRRQKAS
jgi:ATP-dependent RNA helicase DeaD